MRVAVTVALAARVAAALACGNRFAPAHDGVRYHALAERLAQGLGYTWLWPDGTVTTVAHYPVGYPAVLAVAYRLLGASPLTASLLNAILGTLVVAYVTACVDRVAPPKTTLAVGLALALHPGLVLYTPSIMSEVAFSAAVALAAWCAVRLMEPSQSRRPWLWMGVGTALGAAVLVRPQAILFAPGLAWLAASRQPSIARRVASAAVVAALIASVCAPWTVRNCRELGRCVWVSTNSGWNLLIGAQDGGNGGWQALVVPPACEGVFGEVETDACFGEQARRRIAAAPWRWLARVPQRLGRTFNYGGSAGYYLYRSDPAAFSWRTVLIAGALETAVERAALILALLGLALRSGPRPRARRWIGLGSALVALTPAGWLASCGLVAVLGALGLRALAELPVHAVTLTVLGGTLVTHAVFFGEPRFALVTYPWIMALAGLELPFSARVGTP
jgi:4-amino-4-deoxy-L-arabinose transferase-like glycosyltransferase